MIWQLKQKGKPRMLVDNDKRLEQETEICDGNHCGKCCGGSCGGCGTIELTQAEIGLLLRFAVLPFFPVVSSSSGGKAVLAEPGASDNAELSDCIVTLASKGLIQLDCDIPLSNYDYSGFEEYPVRGSMALTFLGQAAIDQLYGMGYETPYWEDYYQHKRAIN